jgi:eukaryotic-like serine/threonine-protein kinase
MTPGSLLGGKYRLDRQIGEGAMGAVWAAVNMSTGREVALKLILRSTDHLRQRLRREARASGKLQHRNVIEIFDVGETAEGDPFLVMPLLTGETLKARIVRERRFDPQFAARVGRDVARALAAAHAAGVIHRDLKPANIFLHQEPDADDLPVVKVLDFGVCKDLNPVDGIATIGGGMVGSLAYISPEQAKVDRSLDHRTDLWSLGVILFEMLAGVRPFKGTAQDILPQLFFEDIPRVESVNASVDPALSDLVARCLERDRDRRISSAAEIASTLQRFVTPSMEMSSLKSSFPEAPTAPPAPVGASAPAPRAPVAPSPDIGPAKQSSPRLSPPPAPVLRAGADLSDSNALTLRIEDRPEPPVRRSQPPPARGGRLAGAVAMNAHGNSPAPRDASAYPAPAQPMGWPPPPLGAGPQAGSAGGPLGQGGTVKMSTDFAQHFPPPALGPPPAPPPPVAATPPRVPTVDPMLISNPGLPAPPSAPSRRQLGLAMAVGVGVGTIGLIVIVLYSILSAPPKAPPAPAPTASSSPIAPADKR